MEKPATASSLDTNSSVKAVSILHVDDDLSFLEISKQILEINSRFEVDTASSVEEAFQKMKQKKYEAIISDYEMPNQNGLMFLKILREQQNDVPFLLFTGKGREDVAIKALNLGSDAYINKSGDPETVYGELSDALLKAIERKSSKMLLADSELKYRKLVEDISQGLIIVEGPSPHIVFVNPATETMTGFSRQELFSFSPIEIANLVHPDNREVFLNRLIKRFAGEEIASFYEFRGIRKDGSMTWLEVRSSLIEYNGQPAVQGIFLDITDRKKAEHNLRESESKYRNIFNNSEAGMFQTRLDGSEILDCNEKFLRIFGRTREEMKSKPSVIHWADPLERQEMVRMLHAKGHVDEFECKMLNKQGEVKICLTSLKLYPEQGILEGSIIDITERKQAEDALKKSQHLVEKILNTTPTLIYIYDLTENRNVYANREILAFLGYSNEQIRAMGSSLFAQILHPDDAERVAQHHSRLGKAGEDERFELEYRMKHSDGEWRWLHSIDIPFSRKQDGDVKQILGSAEDVTERKKAEEALADSEAKYRALVNNADDSIVLTDLYGRSIYRNPAYFKSLGFEEGESETDGFAQVHPDDLPVIKEKMAQLFKTGSETSEYRVKHQNGSWVYRFARSTLIYNHRHEPYAILAIIRDVTENKKAEQALRDSEKKYQLLNEKLNIVGAFARHDIRNKLAVVNGNVFLARKLVNDNPMLLAKLDQIEIANHSIVRILDFSKDYESLRSKALSLVNVGKAVDDAAYAFSDLKGIRITNECVNFNVLADDMLTTIFHNLIENSFKYGEKVTKIKISNETNADGSATILYEDDGAGLDDAIRPKLFEKGVGKGTGYGLYLIKRTCDLYGWTVKETGERNKGVRFELNIPNNQKAKAKVC